MPKAILIGGRYHGDVVCISEATPELSIGRPSPVGNLAYPDEHGRPVLAATVVDGYLLIPEVISPTGTLLYRAKGEGQRQVDIMADMLLAIETLHEKVSL